MNFATLKLTIAPTIFISIISLHSATVYSAPPKETRPDGTIILPGQDANWFDPEGEGKNFNLQEFMQKPGSTTANAPFCKSSGMAVTTESNLCLRLAEFPRGLFQEATESRTLRELGKDFAQVVNQRIREAKSGKETKFLEDLTSAVIRKALLNYHTYQLGEDEISNLGLTKNDFAANFKAKLEGEEKSRAILQGLADGFDSDVLQKFVNGLQFKKCTGTAAFSGRVFIKNYQKKWEYDIEKSMQAAEENFVSQQVSAVSCIDTASIDDFLTENNLFYKWLKPGSPFSKFVPQGSKNADKSNSETNLTSARNNKSANCELSQVERLKENLCSAYKGTRSKSQKTGIAKEQLGFVNQTFMDPKKVTAGSNVCVGIDFPFRFVNGALGVSQKDDPVIGHRTYAERNKDGTLKISESKVQFRELNRYFESIKKDCNNSGSGPEQRRAGSSIEGGGGFVPSNNQAQ